MPSLPILDCPKCGQPIPIGGSCHGHSHARKEAVDHPDHYGGADNPYEAIKVIDAWGLGFSLGNTVKYISRAGKKDPQKTVEDLEKARWYLEHAIRRAKEGLKP